MEKYTVLTDDITNKDGDVIAQLSTKLDGIGTTPEVITIGVGQTILGYNDDGTAIVDKDVEKRIEEAQQKFMAEAIKEQKRLTEANGIDPSVVNVIDAEKETN